MSQERTIHGNMEEYFKIGLEEKGWSLGVANIWTIYDSILSGYEVHLIKNLDKEMIFHILNPKLDRNSCVSVEVKCSSVFPLTETLIINSMISEISKENAQYIINFAAEAYKELQLHPGKDMSIRKLDENDLLPKLKNLPKMVNEIHCGDIMNATANEVAKATKQISDNLSNTQERMIREVTYEYFQAYYKFTSPYIKLNINRDTLTKMIVTPGKEDNIPTQNQNNNIKPNDGRGGLGDGEGNN